MEIEHIEQWRGQSVVDQDGEKVGKLEEVLFDGQDARLGCVGTGLFGRKLNLVPLEGATLSRQHVRVAFPRDAVKNAPTLELDTPVTGELERAAFGHYGLKAPARGGEPVIYESSQTRERRAEEIRQAQLRARDLQQKAERAAADAQAARDRADEAEQAARQAEDRRREAEAEAEAARQDVTGAES